MFAGANGFILSGLVLPAAAAAAMQCLIIDVTFWSLGGLGILHDTPFGP